MKEIHLVLGLVVCLAFLAAGAWGTWRWWRVEPSDLFWRLMRIAQGALVVQVLLGALLLVLGRRPGHLHVLYGLLPLGVSFAAEQLRVTAAEAVLAARDLPDAEAVGRLEEVEQRSVVLQIVRREMGVMALGALICVGLVIRAAFTSGKL